MRFAWPLLLTLLATGCAVSATGCQFNPFSRPDRFGQGRWLAVTGLARADDPAAAAKAAVDAARARLGERPIAAVLFFECFANPADGATVAATLHSLCPGAEMVGCSTVGLATGDGLASDRAVAVLAIAGSDLAVTSAYAPATFKSSQAAGGWLAGQLEHPQSDAAVVLLAEPRTLSHPDWDASLLVRGVAGGRSGKTVVSGGLAGGAAPRVYHAGRAFAGGVVAMQLADGQAKGGSADNLLRIGPVWRVAQVEGRRVVRLSDGQEDLPAGDAVARWLLAQDRPRGAIGRLLDNKVVPLLMAPAAGNSVVLPVQLEADDRLVLLRPGPPLAAEAAIVRALDQAAVDYVQPAGAAGPLTILAMPQSQDNAGLLAVAARQFSQAVNHPAPVAFITTGQFVSLPAAQFASGLFAATQVAPKRNQP